MKRLVLVCLFLTVAVDPRRSAGTTDVGGTLIAAFVTRDSILLCSDGRVVSSSDGAVVRDDWSKVHRLTRQTGLLTGGRDLPGLLRGIASGVARDRTAAVSAVAVVTRGVLEREWRQLSTSGPPEGRAVAIVTGFDERGLPRVFHLDSDTRPAFSVEEIPLFNGGSDLEVVAIATGSGVNQDVSRTIIRHIDEFYRRQPTIDRRRLFVSAFNSAKVELGARNSRIGGATFAGEIDKDTGFRSLN